MKMLKPRSFVLLTILVLPMVLKAHPVSFEDGYSLMSDMGPINQETSFVYSPKWWLGTGLIFDKSMDQSGRFPIPTKYGPWSLTSLHLAFLAKRWNLPQAQGNIYIFGGPGVSKSQQGSGDNYFYRLGIQADYETRRIYMAIRYLENRFFDHQKIYDRLDLAVGFAPYLAKFDEFSSWVLLKLRTDTYFENPLGIPTLRFFYRNFLWEMGMDFKGNSHFGFMARF